MGETSKSMESQLQKAKDEVELWRKTCRELEGHFLDLKLMESQESELEKRLQANLGMFNQLYFEFDQKKLKCFQAKKFFDALVAKDGKYVHDPSLKKRVEELHKQADLWLNHELEMKYFVEQYKTKYERLFLKFKEKKIECEVMKDECKGLKQKIKSLQKRKKSASIGGMERIGYLEDEYKKMETEEKEKGVKLSEEIEGLKCANKRANDEVEELKIQATMLLEANVKLGGELEDYKAKYHGLLAQLNEKAGLEVGLKETIKILEEENKKIKMDQRENCVKLHKEIENLGCDKRKADDEIEVLERKCMELEVQGTVSLNYVIELEKQLKNQMSIMVLQDNELIDCRARCSGMSERETTALHKVAHLEEVVKKMECDKRETENRILESWKGKTEEMESWMKRLVELETRVLSAEEEHLSLRGLKNEVSCRKMHGKVDVANMVHPELTDNMLIESNNNPSSLQGNIEDVHAPDQHYINNNREPSTNVTDEKKNVCFDSTVESVIAVEQQIALKTEGSLGDSLVLLKQHTVNMLPVDVIEVDSEDEVVEVDSEGKELPHISTAETTSASEQCLKRPLSLPKDEECEASSDKVIFSPWSRFCSAQKRLRASETAIGDCVGIQGL